MSEPRRPDVTARALPRLGLLGNPSDAYGGRVLAVTFRDFAATVTLARGGPGGLRVREVDGSGDREHLVGPRAAIAARLADPDVGGGARLLLAALRRFALEGPAAEEGVRALEAEGATFAFTSDIPRQAGLAGSSAIVIAALRALASATGHALDPFRLSEAALLAETEDLGIAAGPQDRVIQACEGLRFMDFAPPRSAARYEALDPGALPPLFVAWGAAPGRDSGRVHVDVRGRYERGDPEVVAAMESFAALADQGRAALLAGDAAAFRACMDRNFDLRARLFRLPDEERAPIDLGRRHGAAMKFPGSGGAVLGAAEDEAHRARLLEVFRAAGYACIAPDLRRGAPTPASRGCRAVLLAAGFATRMYPLTRDFPKPLFDVGGKPILTHLLERVRRLRGLREVCVVTNARFEAKVREWAATATCEVPVRVVSDGATENDRRLGALRDLALAADAMQAGAAPEDDLVVLAGDNLIAFELAPLQEELDRDRAPILMVRTLAGDPPPRKHGEVTLAPDGTIARFREKPDDPRSRVTATAIYLFPGDALADLRAYLEGGGNPDAPGHFLEWLVPRRRVRAVQMPGRWFDIGDLAALETARREWDAG